MLEKKIRFNNKNWLVKVDNTPFFKVFLCDEEGNISSNPFLEDWRNGETVIDVCKNAVLQANQIYLKHNEYEDFMKWDGDMDKELSSK
jgi:hypothetical protein